VLDATVDIAYRSPSPKWPASLVARVAREAWQQGVLISAGTDDDADWRDPDSALLEEISHLVHDVGMPAAQALRAATQTGALTIGEQATMGSLEPGRMASFVVLAGDPLEDVVNLHDIVEVVKRGTPYSRRDYHPVTPAQMHEPPP
jgi:imidazolonepropionase-like amidohydrolase